jgi:hypothetical protein
MLVSMRIPSDMLTMEPVSAWSDSPASSETMPSEYDGWYLIS